MPGSESSNNKRRHSPIEQSSRKRQRTDRDSSSTNQYSIEQLFSSIDELVKKTPSARERRSVSDVSESLANIENILRTTPDLLKLHFEKTAVSTKLSRFISNLRELVSRGYPIKTFPTAIIVKILNSMLREEKSTAYSLTTILTTER